MARCSFLFFATERSSWSPLQKKIGRNELNSHIDDCSFIDGLEIDFYCSSEALYLRKSFLNCYAACTLELFGGLLVHQQHLLNLKSFELTLKFELNFEIRVHWNSIASHDQSPDTSWRICPMCSRLETRSPRSNGKCKCLAGTSSRGHWSGSLVDFVDFYTWQSLRL